MQKAYLALFHIPMQNYMTKISLKSIIWVLYHLTLQEMEQGSY